MRIDDPAYSASKVDTASPGSRKQSTWKNFNDGSGQTDAIGVDQTVNADAVAN
jgi:hypothetical protein